MREILFLAIFMPFYALANTPEKPPPYFCKPSAQIVSSILDCEDNDAFINAGEDCLDKLDAEVKSATSALKTAFAPNSVSQQSAKFHSTIQDYEQSSQRLMLLIEMNKMAIREMDTYSGALNLPEDSDEKEVTGGDQRGYAMGVTCFGESTRSIHSIQNDFLNRLKQLEKTKSATDANLASARLGGGGLENDSQQDAVKNSVGTGSGASVKGNSQNSPSDVTGVRQDQEKQSQ